MKNKITNIIYAATAIISFSFTLNSTAHASPNTNQADAVRIANMIRKRLSASCNGNQMWLLANFILEYKSSTKYEQIVKYYPPTELDKLNSPEYNGTYSIQFLISPAPQYVRKIEEYFPNGFSSANSYEETEISGWLQMQKSSLWGPQPSPRPPGPLTVYVKNFGGRSYISNVFIANDGNWGVRHPVNYAFMPIGAYVDTANINFGGRNKENMIKFWNFVSKIDEKSLFPQTCETWKNPSKVSATAFLINGNSNSSEYIFNNFTAKNVTGEFFTSREWRNSVYRSVGATFAIKNSDR